MRQYGKDPQGLRERLRGRAICLLPYCHSDIAWLHTRAWHVSRYVFALDETLDLLDSDPSFCYFVDTWTEMLRPYLEARPQNAARIARHLADGRFGICGGHWGNLRMTQVGDESIIRNMTLGRRAVTAQFPQFEPVVYSNLDVCIGHSQVPQLMRLGGFERYMAWRPGAALDAQGVPRAFVWEGLSGHSIRVCRVCYCGLNETPKGKWGDDWDETLRLIGPDMEVCAEQTMSTIPVFVGMDDTRPLRKCGDDQPCRTDELVRAWNAGGPCAIRFGTPEHVFRDLAQDDLPVVRGVLDEAEVCYNLNWLGHRSLAWWREKADRSLVEAELWDAFASFAARPSSEDRLEQAWELLLDACPHAVQYLLGADEEERYYMLTDAARVGERVRDEALARLLPVCLPLDATHLAFINPHATGGVQLVRALVQNCDRARGGFALLDDAGRPVPMQYTDAFLWSDELEVEALLDLPPCGARACRIQWQADRAVLATPRQLPLDTTVEHWGLALRFEGGHLVGIETGGQAWRSGDARSFLLPTVQRYGDGTWLPDWLAEDPLPVEIKELYAEDSGPVRSRVTRVLECGLNRFRQNLDVYGTLGEIRATTEMLLREEDTFIGLSAPVPDGCALMVDIPFGVEPRDPAQVPYAARSERGYENIERRIPGCFWGRSWVDVSGPRGGFTLFSEDGDRFFWLHPSGKWLVHFCQRVIHQPEGGWEAWTMVGHGVGRQFYHHVLRLHPAGIRPAELVRRAESLRRPPLARPVRMTDEPDVRSWLAVRPDSVRLSAFYRQGEAAVLRLYNPDAEAADVEVDLPAAPRSAELVDFHLRPIAGEVRLSGRTARLALHPWQIVTVRLVF